VYARARATGVGDSLVEFAKAKGVDLVVLGSRGMGSFKR
jgi:nucleotide-binding universal stress UspA family protein